jgi:WD40 repeat protein
MDDRTENAIDALCEMFREIDVNDDGTMQWEEFTEHLVELASTYYQDYHDDHTPHYQYDLMTDTSHHDYPCEYVRYFPGLDRCVVFERSSRRFKLYDKNLKLIKVVRGHRSPMLAAEYIPEMQTLVTSSVDKTMCFWDNRPGHKFALSMEWKTKKSQVAMKAIDNSLFTTDTNGTITMWWPIATAEIAAELRGHTDIVMDLCALPNLGLIASASLDLTIRLWDLGKRITKTILKGHEKGVVCMIYSQEYSLLISGGLDSYALVWNPRVKNPIFTLPCKSHLLSHHLLRCL